MGEVLDLIQVVPTLDPAKGFKPDPDREGGIAKAREIRKPRTQKIQEPLVLLQPTEHHPGQAQLITVDRPIGTILEQEWSGLITPATKAALLERVERLRQVFGVGSARRTERRASARGKAIPEEAK